MGKPLPSDSANSSGPSRVPSCSRVSAYTSTSATSSASSDFPETPTLPDVPNLFPNSPPPTVEYIRGERKSHPCSVLPRLPC
ncbi:hypothetical protein BOTBODRAFT_28833 [Botryobasidium botryosum FD-172 SS1]|uniref:Uncharacterized protein n=1 Tax=Botryobasidium botryosum (strain FD-172 SS1) TaxID=930990 RepID=A0A067N2U3_BOTB1|nr:hypothetical protein BOTBODRAFT_28833 [Botryobasidium botryosum FD-172 SS1]